MYCFRNVVVFVSVLVQTGCHSEDDAGLLQSHGQQFRNLIMAESDKEVMGSGNPTLDKIHDEAMRYSLPAGKTWAEWHNDWNEEIKENNERIREHQARRAAIWNEFEAKFRAQQAQEKKWYPNITDFPGVCVGGKNTNECPAGCTFIENCAQCELAAKEAGYHYRAKIPGPTFVSPRGCFLNKKRFKHPSPYGQGQVRCNAQNRQGAKKKINIVCMKKV